MDWFIPRDVWVNIVPLLDPISRNIIRATSNYLAFLLTAKGERRILLVNAIAATAYLPLLKWCIEEGFEHTSDVCSHVANVETLKYLRSVGCDWNKNCSLNATDIEILEFAKKEFRSYLRDSFLETIKKKNLEAIKWFIKEDPSLKFFIREYFNLQTPNDFVILKELCELYSLEPLEMTQCIAAQIGYLDYLVDSKDLSIGACASFAAGNGHIHIVKYLNELGFPYNSYLLPRVIRKEQYTLLKFLVEQCNIPTTDIDVCLQLALDGKLELLQWAISKGFPVNESIIARLHPCIDQDVLRLICNNVDFNNSKILTDLELCALVQFTFEMHPSNQESAYKRAVLSGNLDLCESFYQKGRSVHYADCNIAGCTGSIEMLKWLIDHGGRCSVETCIEAIKNGNLRLLKWIYTNCNKNLFISYALRAWADEQDCKDIVNWLTNLDL